jgi:beta-1,4-mannosyl-glycoprotein beta-1,4-N-acetylglucosaminyltransferase
MIITAQPFFNELDLLEVKCRELAGVVDCHLVVEAPVTFTGIPKRLHFAENRERFRDFPVMHVVAELQQTASSPWDRERRQHEFLRSAVRDMKPEIVMYLDADEIPKRDTVARFREKNIEAAHVDMDWVTFFFDRLDTSRRPTTGRIWRFDPRADWGPWRGDGLDESPATVIPNAGWHFDYFNFEDDYLVQKLRAISHAADEGGDSMLRGVLAGKLPGFERTVDYPIERLPAFVQANRARFARNFYAP